MNDDVSLSDTDMYYDQLGDQLHDEYVTWMDNILEGGESLDALPGWLRTNDKFLCELMSKLTERKYGRSGTFAHELKLVCIKSLLN